MATAGGSRLTRPWWLGLVEALTATRPPARPSASPGPGGWASLKHSAQEGGIVVGDASPGPGGWASLKLAACRPVQTDAGPHPAWWLGLVEATVRLARSRWTRGTCPGPCGRASLKRHRDPFAPHGRVRLTRPWWPDLVEARACCSKLNAKLTASPGPWGRASLKARHLNERFVKCRFAARLVLPTRSCVRPRPTRPP